MTAPLPPRRPEADDTLPLTPIVPPGERGPGTVVRVTEDVRPDEATAPLTPIVLDEPPSTPPRT
jgi:hypothetical protein